MKLTHRGATSGAHNEPVVNLRLVEAMSGRKLDQEKLEDERRKLREEESAVSDRRMRVR